METHISTPFLFFIFTGKIFTMKKILIFATLLLAVTFNAQTIEEESKQLDELISIAKNKIDVNEKAKAVVDIMVFGAKAKNKEISKKADDAVAEINNYAAIDKIVKDNNIILSKSISELSKDDLKGFRVSDDKFKEITYIEPKVMSSKYPYIAIKKGTLSLRYVMEYYGSGWIFWDKVIFLYNGKRFEYSDSNTDRSVSSGANVIERSDIKCSPEMIEALREIGNSEKVEVRLSGKSVYDFELQKNSKEAIKKTIELYDKLKK